MNEEHVFLAALDMPDAAARNAYLDEVCGENADLRLQVESLLASHFKSGEFLDVPAPKQVSIESGLDHAVTIVESDFMTAARHPDDQSEILQFLTPSALPDSLGRIGHYEVLQVLGKGGFGIVLRALDDVLQRVVAIKVMAPQLAATSPARKRFLREARSSAQVRHENVVQVYEVGEQPLPYLAMEFIPGETLQQRLDRLGPLEVLETLQIGRQIAEGLAAAHAMDLIHRDIKPGNVLLEGGQLKVKITDFGLARAADDASMTQSGQIAGTPMYMAPEQALGQTLDQRADLFSLGSVIYQMIAGRPPFRANTAVAALRRVVDDTPRPICEIIPETPQWLCDIIAKLHAKKPADRYQSAREVADVLADCEEQLKANSRLQDFSRIPRGRRSSSGILKWAAMAVVVLLPVIALAVTEFAGVTHLFRGQPATDPIKPNGEPMPVEVATKETPVLVTQQELPPLVAVAPFDAAQAQKHQEAWAQHLGVPIEMTNSVGMKFRLIPPGEFQMGASEEEIERALVGVTLSWQVTRTKAEGPERKMTVQGPFYLGQFEVTLGQFRQFVQDTGYKTTAETNGKGGERHLIEPVRKIEVSPDYIWSNPIDSETDDHPVVFVSVEDARLFCLWLSKKEGRSYAVPRDDQWEFACRGGTTTRWFDEKDVRRIAWARENSEGRLHPIGQKAANPFGLFDMHGNAAELCEPVPPKKVARRGGESCSSVVSCRSASRWELGESLPWFRNGFRVAIVGDLRRDVQRIAAVPAAEQVEEVRKELMRLNPGFDGQVEHKSEAGVVTELKFLTDHVSDISPVRALTRLRSLSCSGTFVGDGQLGAMALGPLKGLPLTHLDCRDSPAASDLSALAEMKLTLLDCRATNVGDADVKNLAGMKDLKWLSLWGTKVTDAGLKELGHLKNLQHLSLQTTKVTDAGLSELVGLDKLEYLDLYAVSDVTDDGLVHLARLKALKHLELRGPRVTDERVDKLAAALPALRINLWNRVIEPKVVLAPFTDADVQRIAALPAAEQVEQVRKELMRLNPMFGGKLTPTIENNVVTELSVNTDEVINIAPVRALTGLVYLDCRGTYPNKGKLIDLSPLLGTTLRRLDCSSTQVADLSPLAKLPLTYLHFNHNPVSDLTPLVGMPLLELGLAETKVSDLSPLKGLKLRMLGAQLLSVTDLSPLEGMPLTGLDLYHTIGVTNLEPLAGMPLEGLNLQDLPVSDLSALKGMTTLRTLHLAGNQVSDLSPLEGLRLTDLILHDKLITDFADRRPG